MACTGGRDHGSVLYWLTPVKDLGLEQEPRLQATLSSTFQGNR